MPIRINLLTEALAGEDLRRRDPVRRAIYLGAFGVALSLVWYSSIWLTSMVSKQSLDRIEASIKSRTNDVAQVQNNRKKILDTKKQIEALQLLSSDRFFQGTLMNALQHVSVPNVQLTHLHVDQSYNTAAAVTAKTNRFGTVEPARPPAINEQLVLTLEARDYSPTPGDQVNHFRDALLQQEFFKTRLNPTNGMRLSNLSAPQSTSGGKPSVQFSLECHFLERPQ